MSAGTSPRERPILFSAPMVRAILAGTKTQTRRIVKPQPRILAGELLCWNDDALTDDQMAKRCPYGQPGDRLWLRETWAYGIHAMAAARDEDGPFVYAADGTIQGRLCDRWRPSIHMPRAASRITLEVTDVRVERLQDISEDDALAEGVTPEWEPGCSGRLMEAFGGFSFRPAASAYAELWEQINGPGSWDANPWVWCISFRRANAS